ncbi:hypothetical protein LCGC14_2682630, partial [marine sediment metagenome]
MIPTRRILDPMFGEASLAAANNADASWARGETSPLDQKGATGWLANLYGGVQTGDDWARLNVPVGELRIPDFNSALWSYYMTNAETMGIGIVIWIHDQEDFDKRAEVTQLANVSGLEKGAGWNAHEFNKATTQMFFYGEGTSGTALTAGTQYTWAQFQTDILFKHWRIYRITFDYGWEASGTFDDAWIADIKLNGQVIRMRPDRGGSGRIARRFSTATTGAIAASLTPKTPYRLLDIELKISAAGTTEEDFTVTKDATIGSAYDLLLYSVSTLTGSTTGGTITDLLVPFGEGYEFSADDEMDVAWPNTENRTWGLTYRYQTVFGG